MPVLPSLEGSTFESDLLDRHLVYDYQAHDAEGNPEKWRYEFWVQNPDRMVYAIHGGPMAGRKNFQSTTWQCIRPNEIWQCNWLEETGTIVSLVYDIPSRKITTLLGFSKGHWENNKEAHGDKRNPEDLARWRKLAKIGIQTDRHLLSEQAIILEDFWGAADLLPVSMDMPTL
jgi:Phenolic acid decarboxylase